MNRIRIILREHKSLLNEVTMEQAMIAIKSKATQKIVMNYTKDVFAFKYEKWDQQELADAGISLEKDFNLYFERLDEMIRWHIPHDIEENDKALCAIWLKNQILRDKQTFFIVVVREQIFHNNVDVLLERFFQWKNFIEPREKRDLNRIATPEELEQLISDARPRAEAKKDKAQKLDAASGTEKIYDGEEWQIFIASNKGAACELGKGTDWCTAAPGLDFFAKYYKPEDPLFIFNSKKNTPGNFYNQKYQFHYGSEQFMDKNDTPVTKRVRDMLHALLISVPGITERFPILKSGKTNYPVDDVMRDLGLNNNND